MRIVALTATGRVLGERLLQFLTEAHPEQQTALWFKPQPFTDTLQQAFTAGDALVFICATGIVVRTLAPVIKNKHDDPPVVVLDEQGKFVIPLLSGHEGGANQWANIIAKSIGAEVVITTAKAYVEPIYTVGMGCERHCPQDELTTLLENCLQQTGLSIEQIHSINSIDIKADEQGLLNTAALLKKPYQTFDKEQLSTVEDLLSIKSEYIFKTVGVYGVAESAALVAAQQVTHQVAELVLNKIKTKKATCAIAKSYPVK
ncbi:MAG: cobalt-precorrin 5A hydrolase [Candidatus Endobugula sp.]|jgi:cobalt-precorrin 5A hydrolase